MKYLYASLAAVGIFVACLFAAPVVSAHVLVVDTSGSAGAIVHINPNDSPVAGQKAAIIFDTDKNVLSKNSQVSLIVKNQNGSTDTVKPTVEGPLAVAEYVFPSRGVYELSLSVVTGDDTKTFNYIQRVSSGTQSDDSSAQPRYEWVENLLLGTVVCMIILAILAFNNRRDIKVQSTF